MQQPSRNALTRRLSSLQKKFPRWGADGILFTDICNIRYLTGFTGSEGFLMAGRDEARLLVDGRYTAQARTEVYGISVCEVADKLQGLEQAASKMNLKRIGFEPSRMSVGDYNRLSALLKNAKLIPLEEELRMLRACKDRAEIVLMKQAAAIAAKAVRELACALRSGWTEREAALFLETQARRAGAEQVAFETIVASGENGAFPHAQPSRRKIRHGDFVVVDFGVRFHGYCSDETCTFAIGELTRGQKNAYRAVKRAHDEAIASIQAGADAARIDALARRTLGKKHSRYFVHSTGHGVGLEVHEAPRLAPSSRDVLRSGMTLTVEPGIYYPGLWGIRIEDTVLVKKNGCELITSMSKDLITIE
ncbi:MAG TPA: Xaa-Pro peptidase family protein [Smithellaceae bacterium]|nr:Xaa-Pro peptidase family protein [Smithellaceae bacterium]